MTPMLMVVLAVSASVTAGAPGDRSIEIVSDSMRLLPGTQTATATGHVFAHGSKFEVHCDQGEATYGPGEDGHRRSIRTMHLSGHVHLRRFSDGLVADSKEARYDAATGVVTLLGDPIVTRGTDVLRGEPIDVSTDGDTVAVQQPVADLNRPHKEPVHVTADRLNVFDNGAHLKFSGNVLVKEGALVSRSDVLDADVIQSAAPGGDSEVRRLVFRGNVRAHRGNQRGTCGKATYDVSSTDLRMEDHPVVIQEGNVLRGRIITINNSTGVASAEEADVDVAPGGDQ